MAHRPEAPCLGRGGKVRHGLERLWWAAELTRSGPDYTPTVKAFAIQDTVLWLFDVEAFQDRPAALAYVEFVGEDPANWVPLVLGRRSTTR